MTRPTATHASPAASAQMRAGLVALILLGSFSVWIRPAWACTCLVSTLDQKLSAAAAVFVGDVNDVGVDPADATSSVVGLRVVTVYKGTPGGTALVHTASNAAECGVAFEESKRYLVFAGSPAGSPAGRLVAGLCGGTTADLSETSKLTPIRTASSPAAKPRNGGASTPLRAAPVAVAAALLASVAIARRLAGRRRGSSPT